MKRNRVAAGVRVRPNHLFEQKCIADKFFIEQETEWFLPDGHIYNDVKGEYVFVKGASLLTSTTCYLEQLDVVHDVLENSKRPFMCPVCLSKDIKIIDIQPLDTQILNTEIYATAQCCNEHKFEVVGDISWGIR